MRAAQLQLILESQGIKCALSGRELRPDNCSLDHRTPLSRGGQHVIENVHLVSEEVNRAKGSMTVEEFVAMCCDVAAFSDAVVK
jgi:5-methylcytosine-specific restriction endonuclease McrA